MNDDDEIINATRFNMNTIEILKQFVDTYCDGTHLNSLIDGKPIEKFLKTQEVSTSIMNCCEKLLPLLSDEKAKPHEYSPISELTGSDYASEMLVYEACKTINSNKYWHNWKSTEDHPRSKETYYLKDSNGESLTDENGKIIEYKGHGESIYLLSSIRKLCKESNYGHEYKPHFSYTDDGFDENDITGDIPKNMLNNESMWKNFKPRRLHSHCIVNAYHGPVSDEKSKIVSQFRTRRCGNSVTGGVTDVLSLMYHMLYDHCVIKPFFRDKIERKNKNKMKRFIEEDLKKHSSSLIIIILRECIVRVKMSIFLRLFEGSCCSGRVIDKNHWSQIQKMCRFIDKMSEYKFELENPGDEDENIEEEEEEIQFIGHKRRSRDNDDEEEISKRGKK